MLGDDRVRELDTDQLFSSGGARPQSIEAEPGDDRREPAAQVLDLGDIGSTRPEPGVLDGVSSASASEPSIRYATDRR